MKIFNTDKTQSLNMENLDFEKGYLKSERLFIQHHDAIEYKEAVYKKREVIEESGGISVYQDLVSPAVEAKEAWDEYEDIQVYVPYTSEEIKDKLRAKREPLLNAFDKWEKAVLRGRTEDSEYVMQWYRDLLDLKESAFTNIPERVKYYQKND